MRQNEVDEILVLYNDAVVETPSRSLPEYLIFAEKIISKELERCCRIVCFLCDDGNKPEKQGMRWMHTLTGGSGYEHKEPCKASMLRDRT